MNFKHFENLNVELKISLEDEGLTFDQAISMWSDPVVKWAAIQMRAAEYLSLI